MPRSAYYIVNGITLYRLLMAPVLLVLVFTGQYTWFSWLLPLSFFTDMIDGTLARKLHVSSVFGTKIDSIADDVTVLAGVTALFVFKMEFVISVKWVLVTLVGMFVVQLLLALLRYGKISNFHTYLAKTAALFQGLFLISAFLLPEPLEWLFYTAAIITALELAEEIILVLMLREWRINIKGIYWVMKDNR